MRLPSHLLLFWTICLINGAVLVVGALVLVLSPARVSSDPVPSEVLVVGIGLAVVLVADALLIRWALAPLQRLIARLGDIERLEPTRLPEEGSGPVLGIAQSVNGLLLRLAEERRTGDARALAAQEAERHRIAQELHDEVGQSLTVVLLGLKQVESHAPSELVEELAAVRESARAGLDDVRRVARRLRPGVLEDLGLTSALAALATDFADHSGAAVRRSFAPGLPPLSPEAEVVVYRVAQEALTNAARHADAHAVELSLRRLGDWVVMEVNDDGRGFEGLDEGSGLMGMRERAALVRAELSVISQPRRGTTVRLRVPVGVAS
ncbi:two-component system, NarL family, sensor histidine kinase UhpB [Nocardioides alpinus]|uniref:histidine kinase n=1 Tax=Nocardioides alpinus TaxID=748909 RepID=A0A1I0YA17_9ACTN|nr:sensor histidine kinase [Nocardioides alpinus]PKH38946.1 sensor histidine kinase [Nocardioides alpinus]SFB10235.1 two-component system, NarL family, sensor histidine kinase UhpB [Nocardioides alpinus]